MTPAQETAMRQALEALKYSVPIPQNKLAHAMTISAIEAVLAEPAHDIKEGT